VSKRTSEANKAIEEAWKKEHEFVLEGKGTRDWTSEQQRDILEKGKAYEGNGRAFEGHHMKSVEANPDYQGDPNNIQLLSREEHQAAHNGNFVNPTNGYYDPDTGKTKEFGESVEPCEAESLSNPTSMRKETNPSKQQAETFHESQSTEALEEEMEQEM
jgi:hypothetical protein